MDQQERAQQVEIYERIIRIARGGKIDALKRIEDALRQEIEALDSQLFELTAAGERINVKAKFEEYWQARPRRDGPDPKVPAEKEFIKAVRRGANPDRIIQGAMRCAQVERRKVNTIYIPQAVKWLRDKRWDDYAPALPVDPKEAKRLEAIEDMKRFGL